MKDAEHRQQEAESLVEAAREREAVTPLTDGELKIIADYLDKDHGGCLPDWPLMQTSMGKVDGPIFKRLLVTIDALQGVLRECSDDPSP